MTSPPRLGDILRGLGLVTQQQLNAAVDYQLAAESAAGRVTPAAPRRGIRLGEALVELGFCTDSDIARALSQQQGLPHVDLVSTPADPRVAGLIPAATAAELVAAPIRLDGTTLVVAVADASRRDLHERLERESGLQVTLVIAAEGQVKRLIADMRGDGPTPAAPREPTPEEMLVSLVQGALDHQTRDLYLMPVQSGAEVRFRNRGETRLLTSLSRPQYTALLAHLKKRFGAGAPTQLLGRQGVGSVRLGDRLLEMEFASVPDLAGERAVLHLL
ncbi:MAG: hypothetical protein ACK47B_12815 [Armatimonadota bacterium]